jgi:hypothetical protein
MILTTLFTNVFPPKIYTNGAYDVRGYMFGVWRWKKLWGVVINTKYPNVYSIGREVYFPKYHLFWDKKPQFVLKHLDSVR